MASVKPKIPVTILTGFLGAGKTTLLNHILSADHGMKLAVIENEFGETGVDENVLLAKEHSEETIVEVKNGCICCTVRGDLVVSLKNIYERTKGKLDGIIIETTGLADPAPVCQTFFIEEEVQKYYKIDAVLTVVDAKHILQHLKEVKPKDVENEAVEQVAFADKILLNKIDLVEPAYLDEIEMEIKKINKYCEIVRTQFGSEAPDMKKILNLGKFDLARVEEMDPSFLEEEEHVHDQSVTSIGFKLGPDELINLNALQEWIGTLITQHNQDLFRYKGVIAIMGMEKKFIFQGVHMLFGGNFAGEWGDQPKNSCFCFIGRNLQDMGIEEGFRKCVVAPLRFKVGDRVQANVTAGFTPGTIIKVWDNGNPYRIRLDDEHETEVWGPHDNDDFVRALEAEN